MNFNEEQKLGIFTPTKNILVSAGAGSGKTAVLTQRIIEMFKQGVKPEELLVLTFTNEAALELKMRIKKKVSEEDCIKHLYFEIDSADIGTFDAFALQLVKKYHYLLNVNQDVSIVLDSLLKLKKHEIMDEIFYRRIDKESFKKLFERYHQ